METIRILIPEEVTNYIQMLDYEITGYKSLIKSIILDTQYSYNIKIYDKLINEYNEKHKEFLTMQDIIRENYVPKEYQTSEYIFSIIYNDSHIEIKKISHSYDINHKCDHC